MSRHDDRISLRQMLDHAREAVEMTQGVSKSVLLNDRLLQLALTRLAEIIGEVASRVSEQKRVLHPNVPWAKIIGLRNRIIHGYDMVDYDILWNVIADHIPPLIEQLENIIGDVK
jgi:uncharacterized protein with HEPN domain